MGSFILLTGRMPFKGTDEERRDAILMGSWSRDAGLWSHVSGDALDFVSSLLRVDPEQRLNAKQALEHRWIAEHAPEKAGDLEKAVVDSFLAFARSSPLRRASLMALAWSLTAEERARVRNAFIEMDQSRNGTLDLCELREAFKGVGDEHVGEVFQALRATGQSEICYSDFLASMCASKLPVLEVHVKDVFDRFDCDHSGHITKENLKHLRDCSGEASPVLSECVRHLTSRDAIHEKSFTKLVQCGA